MSKIKRYGYMVILLVTVFVMSPYIIKEVWTSHVAENSSADMSADVPVIMPLPGNGMRDVSGSAVVSNTTVTSGAAGSVLVAASSEAVGVQMVSGSAVNDQIVTNQAVSGQVVSGQTVNDQMMMEQEVITEPAKKEFVVSDASYFDDALFIGDSRTVGICEYGNLKNADFYADTGMDVNKLYKKAAAIPGGVSFETMLTSKQYGKIYIMLGINEIGNNREKTLEKYVQLVAYVREKQPGAIIYIQGNLHVTQSRSNRDKVVNNAAINSFNASIAQMADGVTIFYLDPNEIFDDANGNLNEEYSSDDTHVLAKYYKNWTQWLCERTITP